MTDFFAKIGDFLPVISGIISAFAIFFTVYAFRSTRNLRYSHSVAVLGYPRSGKTTLIVTLLQHILSGKFAKRLRITGNETIDRVIDYNEKITSGENLQPTKDDDSFIYRFQVDIPERSVILRLLGKRARSYDVAIADFPGEYSKKIAEGKTTTRKRKHASTSGKANSDTNQTSSLGRLYSHEYHSWISQADTYLILVDTAEIYKENFDIAEISARIFSAVLYLKESSLEDSRGLDKKPVCLIFTKCDLLLSKDISIDDISKVNFKTVQSWTFDPSIYFKNTKFLERKFKKTIEMLRNNFRSCEVIFHSSYMMRGEFETALDSLVNATMPEVGQQQLVRVAAGLPESDADSKIQQT